jgi:hypothetical protein
MITCAAPDCDNTVVRRPRGRPAIYCSPTCRPGRRSGHPRLTVEIGHPDTSPNGRPTGRVWTVQLRRGPHTVTLADNLGWPSATALADQLNNLLHPTPRDKGDPIG